MTFRVALPGEDVYRGKITGLALDRRYSNPKIDTTAQPPHAGIVFLNWADTSAITFGTVKTVYSFRHGCRRCPAVFASYTFDNGVQRPKGTLPIFMGALGVLTIDADDTSVSLKYFSTDLGATPIPAFTAQIRFYVMTDSGL